MEVVLRMLFLSFCKANIQFNAEKLTWRLYTFAKTLPTTRRVKLIDKKKFAKTAFNKNFVTFVLHAIASKAPKITIYFF